MRSNPKASSQTTYPSKISPKKEEKTFVLPRPTIIIDKQSTYSHLPSFFLSFISLTTFSCDLILFAHIYHHRYAKASYFERVSRHCIFRWVDRRLTFLSPSYVLLCSLFLVYFASGIVHFTHIHTHTQGEGIGMYLGDTNQTILFPLSFFSFEKSTKAKHPATGWRLSQGVFHGFKEGVG